MACNSRRNRIALLGAKAQPLSTALLRVTRCDFFLRGGRCHAKRLDR